MSTLCQSRVLQLVWENSRFGVTKTSMCRSWMSRGILGTVTFQPGCGSQNNQEWFPAGICDPCGVPWQQGKAGCSGDELRGVSAWECCRKVPSLFAQLWDAGSSPQLCVPAVPWQIFLAGMVGVAELPSLPSQEASKCFWCGNYYLIFLCREPNTGMT